VLLGGNLNGDDDIDVLDFAAFAIAFGLDPGADTDCGVSGVHADIDGDGVVGLSDFSFIQLNFEATSDVPCCGDDDPGGPGAPASSGPVLWISLTELAGRGLGHLAAADLNRDGWLDGLDLVAFASGSRAAAGEDIVATASTGSWFDPETWSTGAVPSAATDVVIAGMVTIDRRGAVARNVLVRAGAVLRLANGTLDRAALEIEEGAAVVVEDSDSER
jgi:hypothetical protein